MAISFNGSSDYLEFTLALSYPFTMACWFYANSSTATSVALGACNFSGADDDRITLNVAGATASDPIQLGAITDGGAGVNAQTSAGYTTGTWTHACGVAASATSRTAYISGGSSGSNTTSRLMTGLDRLIIGSRRSAGSLGAYHNGRIAEVAVWNVALTAEEVALLATGLQPDQVEPAALRFYAPLVRNIVDRFGAPLSASSGTTVADHPRIFR